MNEYDTIATPSPNTLSSSPAYELGPPSPSALNIHSYCAEAVLAGALELVVGAGIVDIEEGVGD